MTDDTGTGGTGPVGWTDPEVKVPRPGGPRTTGDIKHENVPFSKAWRARRLVKKTPNSDATGDDE
jgi:hypothetical protein